MRVPRAAEIGASSRRNLALCFGYDDFTLDLGVSRTREGQETLYPRAQLAMAARAAGLFALDGPFVDLGDPTGHEAECRVSRQLGFSGKQCIHPSQIDPINRAFSPSAEEVARARAIVAAYDQAAAAGQGAVRVDESVVDAPVVERARRLLALDAAIRGQ